MMSLRIALLLLCLACVVAPIRGQDDFELGDALDDPLPTKTPTKKPAIPDKPPAAPTKTPVIPNKPPPAGDDGFDLGDALGGGGADHVTKKPVPRPNPGGGGGEFGDADLFDAAGVDPNKPSDPLPPRDMGYTISKMETIQQLLQLLKTPLSILLEIMETTEQSIRDFLNSFKE